MAKEGNYSDFDSKINEFNTNLTEKQERANELMRDIIAILADFSEAWYENTAKSIIKGNYEITLELKKDDLKKLKGEVQELTAKAKSEIKKELIKEEYWPKYYGLKKGRRLEEGLRLIFGKLGAALGEFGYIKDPQVWSESGKSTDEKSEHRFFYPYGLELPEEFFSLYDEYAKVINEVRGLKRNIVQIEREKKEELALDLWNSV